MYQYFKRLPTLVLLALFSLGSQITATEAASPADAGVINKQQIIYWMMKRGELASDASEQEKLAAIEKYIQRTQNVRKGPLVEVNAERQRLNQKLKVPQAARVSTQQKAVVNTTAKVLAILIDFPDLPYNNNRLTSADTSMFYSDYSVEHYRDLLFSTTGYAGPQGQNLMTAYQYYQAASGGSYFFTGSVKGWFRANNNSDYYGANDPNDNNDDIAVEELVKEAVAKAVEGMSAAELATYDVEDPYDFNNNGNFNEPDGNIDHVMLFHSSVGEEAGGGVLGANAIWSHRFFVGNSGALIPGTDKRVFGYTIQPIDAGLGVCVHEFGHDLGLPDEYDTASFSGKGSPVGDWSVMSTGSWAGNLAGSKPVGFSPYARSYLQNRYQGNWVSEQVIPFDSLSASGSEFDLAEAVNHEQVNQLSIPIPEAFIDFKSPFSGSYQYYSDQGDMLDTSMTFSVALGSGTPVTLSMQAHWDIEVDYDYMQVLVNGVAIEGSHTKATNIRNNAEHIITGKSDDVFGAQGLDAWVALSYDLAAYAGQDIDITIRYRTDQSVGGYGMAIDDIKVVQGSLTLLNDGAEQANEALDGFLRIDDRRPAAKRRYILQLRSYNGVDSGLDSRSYEPGFLLWFENLEYQNNDVSEHPGFGLISVVDADQNLISTFDTDRQIRDATFSLYSQSSFSNDAHLNANSVFDDSDDYSAPLQPESGVVLPELGLMMQVLEQSPNSSSGRVRFTLGGSIATDLDLEANISASVNGTQVAFTAAVSGGAGNNQYLWTFGDGTTSTLLSPTHDYAEGGTYTVTFTVTDADNVQVTDTTILSLVAAVVADEPVETSADSSGGGSLGGAGILLLGLIHLFRRRH